MNIFVLKSMPFIISLLIMTYYYRVKKGSANSYSIGKQQSDGVKSFRQVMAVMHIIIPTALFITLYRGSDWAPLLYAYDTNLRIIMIGAWFSLLGSGLFMASVNSLNDAYSPCFDPHIPKQLVTEGVYKYIRHPIYTSNLMVVGGTFVASGSYVILLALFALLGFYLVSIKKEETNLEREFDEYKSYKIKTGKLFPVKIKK